MDFFDQWFEERKDQIEKEWADYPHSLKRWMKASYHYGQDDGVMEAYRDIKDVMSAIKKSLDFPIDEKRMCELFEAMINDQNTNGNINVGIQKGSLNVVMSGTDGKSTYWAANEEAPLNREQQIEIILGAKERHEEHIKRIKHMLMENENDTN
jgi:hypothetical protein